MSIHEWNSTAFHGTHHTTTPVLVCVSQCYKRVVNPTIFTSLDCNYSSLSVVMSEHTKLQIQTVKKKLWSHLKFSNVIFSRGLSFQTNMTAIWKVVTSKSNFPTLLAKVICSVMRVGIRGRRGEGGRGSEVWKTFFIAGPIVQYIFWNYPTLLRDIIWSVLFLDTRSCTDRGYP